MEPLRPFTLRLSPADHALLEREAARLRVPVSTYARENLTSQINWRNEVEALRQEVRRMNAGGGGVVADVANSAPDAVLVEILLLLRRATAPQVLAQVHGEMTRRGVATYQLQES